MAQPIPIIHDTSRFDAHEAHRWVGTLSHYAKPCYRRGAVELAVTAGAFVAGWLLTWAALNISIFVSLALMIPTAGFLVRLFMILHDCSHGSFFPRRAVNDWVGRILGVLTLTPYYVWRRTHAVHHATSGNLGRRGTGDVTTLTIREYLALSTTNRFLYRLYRNPLVLFGIGPIYLFYLQHRLPVGLSHEGWRAWGSAIATNAAIAVTFAGMIGLVGAKDFLTVHIPVTLIAGAVGIWLFYVQHQFENTCWFDERRWTFQLAALHGSVHYDLPPILRWFTANNGVHHLHHLQSRVPFYRYREVLRDHPELIPIGRVTLFESFRCVRLALWDETELRLMTFSETHERYRCGPTSRPDVGKTLPHH